MSNYYEQEDQLDEMTKEMARILDCLKLDIDSVDLYNQSLCASKNDDLKVIMSCNRDEKIRHICMSLEWLRRNSKTWENELKNYLFTKDPISKDGENVCWRPKK